MKPAMLLGKENKLLFVVLQKGLKMKINETDHTLILPKSLWLYGTLGKN